MMRAELPWVYQWNDFVLLTVIVGGLVWWAVHNSQGEE
jgi:hypothetical protein